MEEIERLRDLLREAADIIGRQRDEDVPELLGDGILDILLTSIAPLRSESDQSVYDYLLKHKFRLANIASLRHAIQQNYSIAATVNDKSCFVSPHFVQWYEDGVMFLQGKEQFAGLIGLYTDGDVRFAVAARDLGPGQTEIGPDDLLFLGVGEYQELQEARALPTNLDELDAPIQALQDLLDNSVQDEANYQQLLEENPWMLGAQHKRIDAHSSLDDKNIPDFTGVRIRDATRDIIEIKQPFLPLFRADGEFRAEFYRAWQQAEDYVEFASREQEYLKRRKGLRFANPDCYLLLGYNLDEEGLRRLRRKEATASRVRIITYDDLLRVAKGTAELIRAVSAGKSEPEAE